jgi:hypothetical protein
LFFCILAGIFWANLLQKKQGIGRTTGGCLCVCTVSNSATGHKKPFNYRYKCLSLPVNIIILSNKYGNAVFIFSFHTFFIAGNYFCTAYAQ